MSQVLSGMVINRGGTWIGDDDDPPQRPTVNKKAEAPPAPTIQQPHGCSCQDAPLLPPTVNWGQESQGNTAEPAPYCSDSGALLPPVVNWEPPTKKADASARHASHGESDDMLLPPTVKWG